MIPAPTTSTSADASTTILQLLRTGVAEMRLYDLRVTVERIEGRSVCGMKPGDYFELVESSKLKIPEGGHFCVYALQAVLPLASGEAAGLARRGLARARQPRLLPRSRRASDHAHRTDRRARDALRRPDVSRSFELGLGSRCPGMKLCPALS